jgi:two-component system, LuxR family, response regulator FixJ
MAPSARPPKLALIDDDAALRHALAFAFETAGFEVTAFADGESALAAPDASWRCLILDQKLPGMTGLELLVRLKTVGVVAPALLITTHPSRDLCARAREAGVEIIEKPLLDEVLTNKVRELLAS